MDYCCQERLRAEIIYPPIHQSTDPAFVMTQLPSRLLVELRESFSMALNAITAHKLRSALTLLGVLIGVFSIIVVMTAMRVLERSVETNLSQLGSQTFAIQKWPEVQFGNQSDWEKYWRRKDITLDQEQTVEEKATLAAAVGIGGQLLGRSNPDPLCQNRAHGADVRRNPRQLSRRTTGPSRMAAFWWTAMWMALATFVFWAVPWPKRCFPFGSAVGEELKINGINYTVIGVLASKGGFVGRQPGQLCRSCPSPPRSTVTACPGWG